MWIFDGSYRFLSGDDQHYLVHRKQRLRTAHITSCSLSLESKSEGCNGAALNTWRLRGCFKVDSSNEKVCLRTWGGAQMSIPFIQHIVDDVRCSFHWCVSFFNNKHICAWLIKTARRSWQSGECSLVLNCFRRTGGKLLRHIHYLF